uniref:NADH-ubiquinone oxidoreductase chain 3 n=1 Tax=Cleptocaccobius convexifrons TaxID=206826 RepID=A0A1X9HDC5_9SCAR|nr:NADH deshydrogenase subunit 3 [Cleptocaccobius convexifrons]
MFYLSLLIFIISNILIMLSSIISKKSYMDREKSSPFECGFNPKSSSRMPFSLHFFLIATIFLIFDVEITLLIPMMLIIKISSMINLSLIIFFFMIILLIGIYYEWNQGALNWTK